MGLFSKKPKNCTICNKTLTHAHKPKKEWNIEGQLCGDCHVDKMKEFYEGSIRKNCIECGVNQKITNLWEPRWQWDIDGLLCKKCFDKKEESYTRKKNYCVLCGAKIGFIRYNPKSKWKIDGQLCKTCWDSQKAQHG